LRRWAARGAVGLLAFGAGTAQAARLSDASNPTISQKRAAYDAVCPMALREVSQRFRFQVPEPSQYGQGRAFEASRVTCYVSDYTYFSTRWWSNVTITVEKSSSATRNPDCLNRVTAQSSYVLCREESSYSLRAEASGRVGPHAYQVAATMNGPIARAGWSALTPEQLTRLYEPLDSTMDALAKAASRGPA